MNFFKLITTYLFIISSSLLAQENTLKNQFQKLYESSNNYEIYKIVKKKDYLKLQENTLDSIFSIKKVLSSKDIIINKQNTTITSLKDTIYKLNKELNVSKTKVNNISLFGLLLNKATYNSILWGLISVLFIFLLFFIYKFKNRNILTNKAKESLIDVEQEFEQYKKKTLEKEQKLRRQLQDEINKQRGV